MQRNVQTSSQKILDREKRGESSPGHHERRSVSLLLPLFTGGLGYNGAELLALDGPPELDGLLEAATEESAILSPADVGGADTGLGAIKALEGSAKLGYGGGISCTVPPSRC